MSYQVYHSAGKSYLVVGNEDVYNIQKIEGHGDIMDIYLIDDVEYDSIWSFMKSL